MRLLRCSPLFVRVTLHGDELSFFAGQLSVDIAVPYSYSSSLSVRPVLPRFVPALFSSSEKGALSAKPPPINFLRDQLAFFTACNFSAKPSTSGFRCLMCDSSVSR